MVYGSAGDGESLGMRWCDAVDIGVGARFDYLCDAYKSTAPRESVIAILPCWSALVKVSDRCDHVLLVRLG
jgi:hypothetical protein